jgi:hypothetical protein
MRIIQANKRRWSLAVVVLVIGLSGLATKASAEPDGAVTSAEVERVVEVIREAYDDARAALEQLPRERFETHPVLEASDYDSNAIVTWVERNTHWVPYRGVLRGADGVLLDRKGNSLDRSLLLARLLEDAGYDARLVRGRLSADAVKAILSVASMPAEGQPPPEPFFVDSVMEAAARASSEAAALAKLVGPLPVHIDRETEEAAADHWWIEAKLDDGWTAVDPLLRGPLEAMRPDALERLSVDALPESMFHSVTIRVVIERSDAGETVEEIPLEHALRTADAAYHDFELQFVPYHFETAPDESTAADESRTIADTAREWLPVLRRGRDTIRQQGFNRQGNLERNPERVAIARKAEQATAALQGLGSSSEPDPTHLTALWLEYRLEVPGRELKVVRREIFDLIGPARRRGGAIAELALDALAGRERGLSLLGTHRVVVVSADLPPIALQRAAHEYWANHGPQIAGIVRIANGADDDEVLQRAYAQPLMALDLLGLATARYLLSPNRSSIYLGSPNVLTTHFTVELDNSYSVRHAFDLVVNDVGVIANDSVSVGRIRLEQGVLDTILEAAMSGSGRRSGNAAELFASRGAATGEWHRVDVASPGSTLSGAAEARIADALNAGRIVVAPGQLGRDLEPAWWEIDLATGTTLGIGSRGWGETVSDATMRSIVVGGAREGVKKIGFKIACSKVGADLVTAGLIRMLPGGIMLLSPEAMRMLMQYGCRA